MVEEVKTEHRAKRSAIAARLQDFRDVFREGNHRIFKELCFCIIAANSSAEMGVRTMSAIEDIVLTADLPTLQSRLNRGFRYWRLRPSYIVHTRDYLKREYGFRLKELLESFRDDQSRRDFFALNKDIKGIGFKEASHFLRNIGYPGYAILDKHILTCLAELGVIRRSLKPITPDRYRRVEKKMRTFAEWMKIDMDELDLLLWSRKTGKILK